MPNSSHTFDNLGIGHARRPVVREDLVVECERASEIGAAESSPSVRRRATAHHAVAEPSTIKLIEFIERQQHGIAFGPDQLS